MLCSELRQLLTSNKVELAKSKGSLVVSRSTPTARRAGAKGLEACSAAACAARGPDATIKHRRHGSKALSMSFCAFTFTCLPNCYLFVMIVRSDG